MFAFNTTLPEEAGIKSSSIRDLLLYLDKKEIPMHSLLIMRKDKLVFEKYYAPYKKDTLHRMFSISKSFTAMAISLLADEGKISLDDSITKYFPEYITADTHHWIKETTIRNMLMMRTCHASTTYKVDMKSDWVESFFTVAPTHKPGTVFHYDTSAAHVMCALVEKLTDKPMLEYLREKFLCYLDFSENSYMVKDPFGVSIGGSGLMATPMDILKVLYVLDKKGTVVCNDGEKRTLLNPQFIELATSNLSDSIMTGPLPSESVGYGMQIWQNEMGGFVMYGMGGQLAISLPEQELLIMTTADTQGIAGGNQVIYDGIYNILLPGICDDIKEVTDGKRDYDELMKLSESLKVELPKIPNGRPNPTPCITSKHLEYDLDNNRQGYTKLVLDLSEDASSLKLLSDDKSGDSSFTEIKFGFQNMVEGDIIPSDMKASLCGPEQNEGTHFAAGAIWLRENVLYIRVHLIGECVGSLRFELYFGDGDITVFMRKIEETYFREFDGHLYGTLRI
ncbi:MAG: beta-lactamase family protein [Butyrivibrio sp.]|uniref:serine hydrolase domain-containing protein n=1 Tax=Butyrivibrio sp. TaxID=28121 RepID=UPI0025C49550|nr:serine hydrolase domain-containing protein [Butyrivibrio sp.]MBQ6587118.1 beta-lactamase family protein [Butyrivibrio sp.]